MDYFSEVMFEYEWEFDQSIRNMQRMYKTSKNYRCPRKEALWRYRKDSNIRRCGKESFWIRKATMRQYRRMLKRQIENETYYRANPHDYKTGGWLTW